MRQSEFCEWIWLDATSRARVQNYNFLISSNVSSVSVMLNGGLANWWRDPFSAETTFEEYPAHESCWDELRVPLMPPSVQAILNIDNFVFGYEPKYERLMDYGSLPGAFRVVRAAWGGLREDIDEPVYDEVDLYFDIATGTILRWDKFVDGALWTSNYFDVAIVDGPIAEERFDKTLEPDWAETDAQLRLFYKVDAAPLGSDQ